MRARALRQNSTDAECRIWSQLRDRRLGGFKFLRQHPVGPFYADFACLDARLVVEIDGGQHFEPDAVAADARRTAALQRAGFEVLRFDNRQVLTETDAVLSVILERLHARSPHPNPLPQAGEGANQGPLPQAAEGAPQDMPASAGQRNTRSSS
ncbi:DNA methyltransferase [Rubrivivax gelatinosus]|nr:DNA methyltransferase [Rubrivivax gelatinosus]